MTPGQLKRLRQDKKISHLDLAAITGLPADYIEKIEEGKAIAFASDLARLERALRQAELEKADPDIEEKEIDRESLNEE